MNEFLPISAVILTKNEAPRMQRCLESLKNMSEVIICDSYSTDSTLEEALRVWLELGRTPETLIRVSEPWQGFVKARNASSAWATQKWILWIDADERISPELESELKEITNDSESRVALYAIPRLSYFLGRPIYHGGWYPDRKLRLARRGTCEWRSGPNGADVHEDLFLLDSNSIKGVTRQHFFHEGFRDQHEQYETNQRYSSLLAEGLASKYKRENKSPPSLLYVYIKVVVKFLENYVWKLGFMDGGPGLLIALGSSKSLYWRFMKLRKLLEKPQVQLSRE